MALEWSAPPECPAAQDVRAAIDRNLSRAEFGPELSAVIVEAAIAEESAGWRLRVAVALPSGSVARDVTSSDCSELADAAGLIIAVALDPLRVVHTVEADTPTKTIEPPPPRKQEVDAERPPKLEEPAPPPAAPVDRMDVDLRLAAVGEFGSLALFRGGVGFGVGIVGRIFRVDVAGQYWAPRTVRHFGTDPDAGVAVQQTGLGVRGCLLPRLGPIELSSCAGFEAGASWGTGLGIGIQRTTVVPWAAVVLGQEVAWTSRRRVGVFAGIDAMLWVVRPRFRVQDVGAVETRPVGVRVVAGPSIRI